MTTLFNSNCSRFPGPIFPKIWELNPIQNHRQNMPKTCSFRYLSIICGVGYMILQTVGPKIVYTELDGHDFRLKPNWKTLIFSIKISNSDALFEGDGATASLAALFEGDGGDYVLSRTVHQRDSKQHCAAENERRRTTAGADDRAAK